MKKPCFIHTNDEPTKLMLEQLGFVLVNYNNGVWTFINDSSLHFDNKDIYEDKIMYSNLMHF